MSGTPVPLLAIETKRLPSPKRLETVLLSGCKTKAAGSEESITKKSGFYRAGGFTS